jgi:hypothetical protein
VAASMVAYARAPPHVEVTISQPSALRMLDDVELVTLPPPEFQIDQILVTRLLRRPRGDQPA